MPDNNTNLPILDDIIKPGKADKAVHQPSSKVQSSLWSDNETSDLSTTDIDAIDGMEVPPATDADDAFAMDEPVQDEVYAGTDETRASAINSPDLEALTEEILGNMMLEMEQLLRDKIRQTLSRHFSGEARPD